MIDSIILALGAGGAEGGGGFQPLILMGAMFAIFYFLLIRPQQKKSKEHRQMLSNLRKGDRIVTAGGMYGTVEGITPNTLTVKIAEGTKVKLTRSSVATVVTTEEEKE